MDRFVSNYTLRLDAKGRVSIPATFRQVLARDGFDGLYCYPSLDRPAIDAGGNALLGEIERLMSDFPPYSDEREDFSAALYGTSETLKIDGEGRVTLSERLKEHAGIADAVGFVGLGHKFQIWEPDRFRAHLTEATRKVRARKAAIGFPECGAERARSTGVTTGRDGFLAVAGGPARHTPVLAATALGLLNVRPGGFYVDSTFGAGGHTRMILAAAPDVRVLGIDRDQSAIARGADLVQEADGRLTLAQGQLLGAR